MKLFKSVQVNPRSARESRVLPSARRLVVGEMRKLEKHLRGTLKAFGLKTGNTSRRRFEPRIREVVAGSLAFAEVADGLLQIRRLLLDRLELYDKRVLETGKKDVVCRRLITAPGVGPILSRSAIARRWTGPRDSTSRAISRCVSD